MLKYDLSVPISNLDLQLKEQAQHDVEVSASSERTK